MSPVCEISLNGPTGSVWKRLFPMDWRLLVKGCISGCRKTQTNAEFFDDFWVFGYSRTTLLSIEGELPGGGTVAVAVDVSDM